MATPASGCVGKDRSKPVSAGPGVNGGPPVDEIGNSIGHGSPSAPSDVPIAVETPSLGVVVSVPGSTIGLWTGHTTLILLHCTDTENSILKSVLIHAWHVCMYISFLLTLKLFSTNSDLIIILAIFNIT